MEHYHSGVVHHHLVSSERDCACHRCCESVNVRYDLVSVLLGLLDIGYDGVPSKDAPTWGCDVNVYVFVLAQCVQRVLDVLWAAVLIAPFLGRCINYFSTDVYAHFYFLVLCYIVFTILLLRWFFNSLVGVVLAGLRLST